MAGKNDAWKYAHLDTTEATMTTADGKIREVEVNGSPDDIFFDRILRAVESNEIPGMEAWNVRNAADMLKRMKAAASPASGGEWPSKTALATYLADLADEQMDAVSRQKYETDAEAILAFIKSEMRYLASPAPAVTEEEIARIKKRIDICLNDCLCEMKPGYDDSIVGFNEAWDIVRKVFAEAMIRGQRGGKAPV